MRISDFVSLLNEHQLLINSNIKHQELDGEVRTDNRLVENGDAFVCIKGFSSNGHDFAPDAINRGATLIIHEDDIQCSVDSIRVKDCRKAAALACKVRYDNPSSRFCLIGVTGTNGKTTVTQLLHQALSIMGFKCGLIGTLGYYIDQDHFSTNHTTPDIIELNAIFMRMAQSGISHVIMEVSSHAISLDRVYGLEFDFCLFTNLGRDHLDFHKDLDEYAAAKARLFFENPSSTSLINLQDQYGEDIYENLKELNRKVFSISEDSADFHLQRIDSKLAGTRFELLYDNTIYDVTSNLIGAYNVRNIAMVIAVTKLLRCSNEQILRAVALLKAPAGRFESIPNKLGIGVYVDYAHTPDALENVLRAASELPKKRLLCLIGAGGDRDRGKRPLMLQIAMYNSDAVIVTNDNPRTENPNEIIKDIVRDTSIWMPWWIIRNREEAIHAILRLAQPGDIVVICGKGHETYQEIDGIRHHFDDREVARSYIEILENIKDHSTEDSLVLPIDPFMLEILYEQTVDFLPEEDSQLLWHISLDSRSIQPNSLYYAICGERFDGHAFIEQVLTDETNYAIGDSPTSSNPRCLIIENTINSLGQMCRKYLLMFSAYKVALTGSTGKTTCKEMIYQVLSQQGKTLKSEKNENNIIGLCKTIMRIKPWHEYAVFELGTNHFGEIAALSDVCFPDFGIILNIGPSHLEFFGDEDGVFNEKTTLFARPLMHKIYPADDDRFKVYKLSGVSVGFSEDADYRITDLSTAENVTSFKLNNHEFSIPYGFEYYATNAAFAATVGYILGFEKNSIKSALAQAAPLSHRMQSVHNGEQLLLVDCYNANPVSMLGAVEHWHKNYQDKPHIAVLGDMLELGENSIMYHQMIAAVLSEMKYDLLITVGDHASFFHPENSEAENLHYANVTDLIESGVYLAWPLDSCILLKGSHGIHLEDILLHILKGDK